MESYLFRKKRTATESNDDEEKNKGSDELFQSENDAKRAKLAQLNDALTLQDLPTELIELILIKAVAMEVKSMKLVKSVWKEKANLVISRLRTVCSHWDRTFTTNFFRKELHRILDETAQETILLEILHQSELPFLAHKLTTMKDEMFVIANRTRIIVYNLNNFAEVKGIIELPGLDLLDIAVCNVSNCVYVLVQATDVSDTYSILRITKNEEHQFKTSPWIDDVSKQGYPRISVSANGILMIRSSSLMICTYDASGQFQHQVRLSGSYSSCFGCSSYPFQKSNGNFLLACDNVQKANATNNTEAKEHVDKDSMGSDHAEESESADDTYASTKSHVQELIEFDSTGNIARKWKTSSSIRRLFNLGGAQMSDSALGRFVISETDHRIRLFDAEFNRLEFTGPRMIDGKVQLHYNSERNEVVGIGYAGLYSSLLTIFRFKEE